MKSVSPGPQGAVRAAWCNQVEATLLQRLQGWIYERSEELLMDLPDEKVLLNTSNCAEIFRVSAQVTRIWKKRMIRKKRVTNCYETVVRTESRVGGT